MSTFEVRFLVHFEVVLDVQAADFPEAKAIAEKITARLEASKIVLPELLSAEYNIVEDGIEVEVDSVDEVDADE